MVHYPFEVESLKALLLQGLQQQCHDTKLYESLSYPKLKLV
jgi:hypothetical protein